MILVGNGKIEIKSDRQILKERGMRPEPYDIRQDNRATMEVEMIALANKGLSPADIRLELGLDEFSEEYIEDVTTAPGNYGLSTEKESADLQGMREASRVRA